MSVLTMRERHRVTRTRATACRMTMCVRSLGKNLKPAKEKARKDQPEQERGINGKELVNRRVAKVTKEERRGARKAPRAGTLIGTVTKTKTMVTKAKAKARVRARVKPDSATIAESKGISEWTVHTSGPTAQMKKMTKVHHGKGNLRRDARRNFILECSLVCCTLHRNAVVVTEHGSATLTRAVNVRRIPESERWDADRILGMRAVPWSPDGSDHTFDIQVGMERPAEVAPRPPGEVSTGTEVARTHFRRADTISGVSRRVSWMLVSEKWTRTTASSQRSMSEEN